MNIEAFRREDFPTLKMEDIEKLEELVPRIEVLNQTIEDIIIKLQDYYQILDGEWETQTSQIFFDNFRDAIYYFRTMKQVRRQDVSFLKNVIDKYKEYESLENESIDQKVY